MNKVWAVSGLFFFLLISSNDIHGFNLNDVVEEAMEKNPEVLAAKNQWNATKAKIPQKLSWPDPQFGISFEKIPDPGYSPADAEMKMYSISQMIPFPGKLTMKARIALKDARIAEENYEKKKNEVVAKVKSVYYSLYYIHKSIETNRENKELIQKFSKIAESKYVVGKASQHDVLKAQVELSLIIDDLISLEHDKLPSGEARLNALLNRHPDSTLGTPEDFEIPELDKSQKQIEEIAIENQPNLKIMKYAVEKSGDALTLAKMGYLPDFMVKLMQEEMLMPMGKETTRGIMFSMNIPLWFWKQGFGIKENSAQKRALEASYQAMKNMVLYKVQEALSNFNTSERRVNLFRTSIIPQAEQALKAATIAYQTGKIDFLTLMNSERMLRDARLKYYETLSKHGQNFANLEMIVGVSLSDDIK